MNQRHACGTGDRAEVLRNRSSKLVNLYGAVESFATSLGSVEVVARERYVLFRSKRIFADLVVMSDALRLAIHLSRKVDHRLFIKIGSHRKQVTHVAKLHDAAEFEAMKPFLREAYEYSVS
jgi:predicted transport protein